MHTELFQYKLVCLCKHSGQLLQSIMEMLGEWATYLALMEATLRNYKLEKQAFIPLWKELIFPSGLSKIYIFLCIWELPHRQGWQEYHCSQAPHVCVSLRRAISNPLPSYLGDSLCCPLRPEPGGRGGMTVQHQKQQQSICKLPSWKYMQTRREDCHGWKKAVIPKSFLYTQKFKDGTCSTVQSHQLFPTSPSAGVAAEVWEEQTQCAKEPQWSPCAAMPMPPQHKEAARTMTFHRRVLFLHSCWSRYRITTGNSFIF